MNRFLIDTNILTFFLRELLDRNTENLLQDYSNQIYISSISVMEFINLVQSERVKSKKIDKENLTKMIEEKLGFTILYGQNITLKSWKNCLWYPSTTTRTTV